MGAFLSTEVAKTISGGIIKEGEGGVQITPTKFAPLELSFAALKGDRNAGVVHKMRLGMMVNGIDLSSHPGGVASATHGESELEDTVSAMRNTVRMLRAEGEI